MQLALSVLKLLSSLKKTFVISEFGLYWLILIFIALLSIRIFVMRRLDYFSHIPPPQLTPALLTAEPLTSTIATPPSITSTEPVINIESSLAK
jgi:hypothetical protein